MSAGVVGCERLVDGGNEQRVARDLDVALGDDLSDGLQEVRLLGAGIGRVQVLRQGKDKVRPCQRGKR